MKYIIGIDGGGTKTNCAIADIYGKLLFESTSGPSNFLINGKKETAQIIFNLVEKCVLKLNADFRDIKIILIGTAGAGRSADATRIENEFISFSRTKGVEFELVKVESDARIALEGAFAGEPGSILISGTGSIIFLKDSAGNVYRAGGFGRIIGDEGSGYALGRKGLSAIAKEFDGRIGNTLISELVKNKFGISTTENLIDSVYKNNLDISSVAPLVIQAAEKGDSVAEKILDKETDELALLVAAMITKVKQPFYQLSFIGGIISNENYYSKMLKEKIGIRFPQVSLYLPKYSPEVGAILMGKELLKKN